MPPPIKKRLSSSFALGFDLPGWPVEDSKISDDELDLHFDASLLPCSSSKLQLRTETPMFGHGSTSADAPPQLTTVSKNYKVISEPLIATPSISLYWESLFGSTSRYLPTPVEPIFGLPSSTAGSSNRCPTPYASADQLATASHSHPFDLELSAIHSAELNEQQRFVIPHLHDRDNANVQHHPYVFPQPQQQPLHQFQVKFSDTASEIADSEGEKCATPIEITNYLPDGRAVKYRRVAGPSLNNDNRRHPGKTQQMFEPQGPHSSALANHHGETETRAFQPPSRNMLATTNTPLEPSLKPCDSTSAFPARSNTSAFSRPLPSAGMGKNEGSKSKPLKNIKNVLYESELLSNKSATMKIAESSVQSAAIEGHRQPLPITRASGFTDVSSPSTTLDDINYQGCICKRSRCLKLYCKCFRTGNVCDPVLCKCKECRNTKDYDGPKGERTKIIKSIRIRRPDAFSARPIKQTGEGCACKKNRCLKKYCDCYSIGAKCSDNKCTCNDCQNGRTVQGSGNDYNESAKASSIPKKNAFTKKNKSSSFDLISHEHQI